MITTAIPVLAGIASLFGACGLALGASTDSDRSVPFTRADVHFEQNATDGDVEVVFAVKGGDDGLAKLTILSPDGRTVFDFTAPDISTLGIRQFSLESPEPKNVNSLKSAYPEGVYTFSGVFAGPGTAGVKLHGESTLNHELPATASFVRPEAEAKGVRSDGLEIAWRPVSNVAAYIIEIEQDDLGVGLEVRLPASATTFAVSDGFLLPNTEYELAIGTLSTEGNISIVETTFTTAGKE